VSVVVPFRGIDEAPKVFDTVGGETANAGLANPATMIAAAIAAGNARQNVQPFSGL
jgi:hypothetical protein